SFLYFTSHTDIKLINAVRKGRKAEMNYLNNDHSLDSQAKVAFFNSQLNKDLRFKNPHNILYRWYQSLICLRKTIPALAKLNKENVSAYTIEKKQILFLNRWEKTNKVMIIFNFSSEIQEITLEINSEKWKKII